MELFDMNGHLTREGLKALVSEGLDEMGRLEAAEHLGYCDACMTEYLALLTDDVLLTPAEQTAPAVVRRIHQKKTRQLWSRYATVAAAAALAVLIWGVSTFTGAERKQDQMATPPQGPEPGTSWISRVGEGFNGISANINAFFGGGDAAQQGVAVAEDNARANAATKTDETQAPVPQMLNAPPPATTDLREKAREEKENLFGSLVRGGLDKTPTEDDGQTNK